MRYVSLTACVLVLAAVAFAAGCIGTDTPAVPTLTPVPSPLAGDPALGIWTASEQSTQTGSGTTTEISTNYTITISVDGSGTVAYDRKERKGYSFSSDHYSMDGTVSKSENVYTIDAQLLGKYVVTLSENGSATLTTPAGSELPLHKSEV
jgi:hypothetical protein